MAQDGRIIIALSNIETAKKLKSLLMQEGYENHSIMCFRK